MGRLDAADLLAVDEDQELRIALVAVGRHFQRQRAARSAALPEGVLESLCGARILAGVELARKAALVRVPVIREHHVVLREPRRHVLDERTGAVALNAPFRDRGGLAVRRREVLLPLQAVFTRDRIREGVRRVLRIPRRVVVEIGADDVDVGVARIGCGRVDVPTADIDIPHELEAVGHRPEGRGGLPEGLDEGALVALGRPGHPVTVELPAKAHVDRALVGPAGQQRLCGSTVFLIERATSRLRQRGSAHDQRNAPDRRAAGILPQVDVVGQRVVETLPTRIVDIGQNVVNRAPEPIARGLQARWIVANE